MAAQTRTMTGTVGRALVSPGSKSEHEAVVLRTARGDQFVLRRAGGHAFRDETLEALVGKTITGTGIVAGQTFIMQDWKVMSEK
jgi:hypothetical protein